MDEGFVRWSRTPLLRAPDIEREPTNPDTYPVRNRRYGRAAAYGRLYA